jgi:succinate dehydrogenase/fumarate reductase flavoprotein subunit
VNCESESKIEGLFLAGEITTGLHGANRLMGTGLLESLVGGMIAGKRAAAHAIARNL